ncbi:hypothetical protein Tiera_044 [Polaromonas phage Tiera]|nr:hypothetical protein Tiera_044 [Polaromonas phage Tiera]
MQEYTASDMLRGFIIGVILGIILSGILALTAWGVIKYVIA